MKTEVFEERLYEIFDFFFKTSDSLTGNRTDWKRKQK